MGHDYGVVPRFLSITPTRDNLAAPGNRMPDKHSRLFHGRTLDEWLMLQLWSSKYLGQAYFVCETDKHAARLRPLAEKYGIRLMVRPEQMLSYVCDSGSVILQWATRQILRDEWWALYTTPFVVSPCRPPGFFDMMVEKYLAAFPSAPDFHPNQLWVCAAEETETWYFSVDDKGRGREVGHHYNRDDAARISSTDHWMASTFWHTNHQAVDYSRHDTRLEPVMFTVPAWQCIHIDNEEHWNEAEFYFGNRILNGGWDCYERYRASWEGK